LRQWGGRYAIHAGQQLTAKEFRYLRTVRVTAAVYWGLGSFFSKSTLTFQHWAGVRLFATYYNSQSPVFLVNSRPPLFA